MFAVSHIGRKPEKDPKTKMKRGFSSIIKKIHQFQSIKSNKEVTPKTRETDFLYRKPQKLKFVKFFSKIVFEKFLSRGNSHSAENTKSGQLLQK